MKKYILLFAFFLLVSSTGLSQYDSIFFDGGYRTYQLHLPTGYTGTSDIPLVIAMHGGTGSGPQLALQSLLNPKSNAEDFIVVYPEGEIGTGLRTWNAGWCCGYAVANDVDDVGFISALIDSLNLNFAVDLNRVYATGMSNGGFMAYRLACELSDRIAAIAPVAASMGMDNCTPTRAVPIISFHSYLDDNVPLDGGVGSGLSGHWNSPQDSVLTVWSQKNNCDLPPDTLQNDSQFLHLIWNNCNCDYTLEQYITQDGGHSWPGGIAFGDPVSTYIDATDLMWDFFMQYDLSCPLGIEKNKSEMKIYPNPTNDFLRIELSEISTIRILNLSGGVIYSSENLEVGEIKIDASDFSSGVYLVEINTSINVMWDRISIID